MRPKSKIADFTSGMYSNRGFETYFSLVCASIFTLNGYVLIILVSVCGGVCVGVLGYIYS